jgi:hypothetical protein
MLAIIRRRSFSNICLFLIDGLVFVVDDTIQFLIAGSRGNCQRPSENRTAEKCACGRRTLAPRSAESSRPRSGVLPECLQVIFALLVLFKFCVARLSSVGQHGVQKRRRVEGALSAIKFNNDVSANSSTLMTRNLTTGSMIRIDAPKTTA